MKAKRQALHDHTTCPVCQQGIEEYEQSPCHDPQTLADMRSGVLQVAHGQHIAAGTPSAVEIRREYLDETRP